MKPHGCQSPLVSHCLMTPLVANLEASVSNTNGLVGLGNYNTGVDAKRAFRRSKACCCELVQLNSVSFLMRPFRGHARLA